MEGFKGSCREVLMNGYGQNTLYKCNSQIIAKHYFKKTILWSPSLTYARKLKDTVSGGK